MKYAYKVKTLYDGSMNQPQENRIILVNGKIIENIVPWSSETSVAEDGYQVVDMSGCFAMPGMIDGHVHTILPGDGTSAEDFISNNSYGEILLTAAENIQKSLKSGVTVLRDCGAIPEIVFELRNAVRKGIIEGPDLLLCGSSLTTTAGHTHFFCGETDTPDQTVEKIRQLHKQGADFVKLIATGGGTKGVIQHAQMLSCEQMRAAADEARRLGKISTAHVCTTATARAAVDCGVDMLEHLIWADEHNNLTMDFELAEEIAQKDIPVCITASVISLSLSKYENAGRALTDAEQSEYAMLCRFRDTINEGFRLTCDRITYIPGTDAGWRSSRFDQFAECVIIMANLGMGSLRALNAATGTAAKVLGIDKTCGTLEKGKAADFVVLKKSPVEKIENLRNIYQVYKNGRCVTNI